MSQPISTTPPVTVRCPICRNFLDRSNPEFPFCSPRCRTLDLGNWASERYVISSPIQNDDEEERVQLRNDNDDEATL